MWHTVCARAPKPLYWVGSSLKNVRGFPEDVRAEAGYGLYLAQLGGKHPNARPLRGFSGASDQEIAVDRKGATYRIVYTLIKQGVYVLHAFQKKAKKGIKTPKHEIDLTSERLKWAQQGSNDE